MAQAIAGIVPARQDKARANGRTQCFITGFAANIFQVLCLTVPKIYSNQHGLP
jgi:hypothetical protein